jgi:RHS repeat-associated protein
VGSVEYSFSNDMGDYQFDLDKVYNAEGYVIPIVGVPHYYYYRKDHTGDNREVWYANTNTTVQKTQYYASGLPWDVGIGASVQNRKYNGKEFIEMHGYDTYDIVWRQYYPAIGRFQSPDPEIEDAYNESPYAMCDNNMVNRTDPDGIFWNYVAGAVAGAAVEYAGQVVTNVIRENGISLNSFTKNIDLADIGVAAIEGAVTSGGSAIKSAGAKFAVAAGSEIAKNIVNYKKEEGVKFNDAKTVVKNTAIGLVSMGATSMLKVGAVTKTKTQALNTAREKAHSLGVGLPTSEAKKIASNQVKKNAAIKIENKVGNYVNKPIEAGVSGGYGYVKDKTDKH